MDSFESKPPDTRKSDESKEERQESERILPEVRAGSCLMASMVLEGDGTLRAGALAAAVAGRRRISSRRGARGNVGAGRVGDISGDGGYGGRRARGHGGG